MQEKNAGKLPIPARFVRNITLKPLTSIDAHQPFDHIMVDLVTDLPKSQDNYVHALVITDVFSKFTLLFPLVDKKGNSIVKILAKVVADHGTPKII